MSENQNKLSELIETSLGKIKDLAESETVIGKPIETPGGVTVIPVSKLSIGFASGGLDYSGKIKTTASSREYAGGTPHFGGGGGTGVTMSPVAFLIISPDGKVELLPVTSGADAGSGSTDRLASVIERSPEIIEKIKNLFGKKKKKIKDAEPTEEPAADTSDEPTVTD